MKIFAYLALAGLLIGAATGYTAWIYGMGQRDKQAEYDAAGRQASDGKLVQADKQSRIDDGIAFAATVDVHTITTSTAARRDIVARADLTPARPATTGGHDAARACPDVLSGRFVRLFNGAGDEHEPAAAPPTSAAGVPPGG